MLKWKHREFKKNIVLVMFAVVFACEGSFGSARREESMISFSLASGAGEIWKCAECRKNPEQIVLNCVCHFVPTDL